MRVMKRASVVVLALWVACGWAQTEGSAPEQGAFHLHKFEQLIGRETYTLTRFQAEVVLKSDFKFTDRGSEVPLTTVLTMEKDLTPRDFHGLFPLLSRNQILEQARTDYVGPLTHDERTGALIGFHQFDAGVVRAMRSRPERLSLPPQLPVRSEFHVYPDPALHSTAPVSPVAL